MISTGLNIGKIHEVYARFSKEIDAAHWMKRVTKCKTEIRGNKFLQKYLEEENAIAYQLAQLNKLTTQQRYISETKLFPLLPAAAFATQILSLIEDCSRKNREQLRARVRGAFKNPPNMRGLRLELLGPVNIN